MNHKGLPCPVRKRQGLHLTCQEGDCSNCEIQKEGSIVDCYNDWLKMERDRLTEKQLDDIKSMTEAYSCRSKGLR